MAPLKWNYFTSQKSNLVRIIKSTATTVIWMGVVLNQSKTYVVDLQGSHEEADRLSILYAASIHRYGQYVLIYA